jgi:hypothetical protein
MPRPITDEEARQLARDPVAMTIWIEEFIQAGLITKAEVMAMLREPVTAGLDEFETVAGQAWNEWSEDNIKGDN